MVDFCNWCPVPKKPSPAHHPYGHPRHVTLKTWAEVAEGLRRAGWTVEFKPLFGMPPYQWRSPAGMSGSGYRSDDPDAPPEGAMKEAYQAGVIGFLFLVEA